MSRLSVRARLALTVALATGLLAAVLVPVVQAQFAASLDDEIDRELRSRATELAALVRVGDTGLAGELEEPGFAEVQDARGRVLDATPALPRRPLLSAAELAKGRTRGVTLERDVDTGDGRGATRVRLRVAPVTEDGLFVVAGEPLDDRDHALSVVRASLGGGALALVLLASATSWLVARAALAPVEAMRRRAALIAAVDPAERLASRIPGDELARLGDTLNSMLARVHSAVEHERRFVLDASHELRTPIAVLRTEVELALRGERPAEELRAALRSALDETDRLERLAEDLLLLGRVERGSLAADAVPLRLSEVFAAVRGRHAARLARERRGLAVVDPGELSVRADPLRLEQALDALIDNAVRHGRGTLVLSARAVDGCVEAHVRDDGPGFPDGFAERAFERFARGENARSDGSGLGLAIVRSIAEAHGGRAAAGNRPGGGADVWIVVPAASAPGEHSVRHAGSASMS